MQIMVDADACSVKELIIDLAVENDCPVFLVSSLAHYSQKQARELVELIFVDSLPEAVDMKILSLVRSGDLVVTGDYGLAALLLPKEVSVISPRGKIFNEKNIDYLLARRHYEAKLRRAAKKTKGPKKYSPADKDRFIYNFKKLLSK